MSIFKETLRDFVVTQLKIREAIIEQGNNPTKFRHRFGNPRLDLGGDNKINIAAGAFYTNTVQKQCVISMTSGVNITDPGILEAGEKLTGDLLAKNYILEGGIITTNNKPREGFTTAGRNPNPAYGDSTIRSDAKDGFGIVPMPGIIDADIRTKTAYGSLREAKINFVCHNRRQLEVLEILYMRPGMPILLEWGWSPYIDNEGRIEKSTSTIRDDFFKAEKTMDSLQEQIRKQIETAGGNYDGFIGTCKNFEIVARTDGGYDCTTELIAMGECLEGLKARKDGDILNRENEDIEVDTLEFLLEAFLELGEYKGSAGTGTGNLVLDDQYDTESTWNWINNWFSQKRTDKKAIERDEKFANAKTLVRFINKLNKTDYRNFFNIDLETFSDVYDVETSDVAKEVNKLRSVTGDGNAFDQFFLFKGETIKYEESAWSTPSSNFDTLYKAKDTFIRWDFLCLMMNTFVFPEIKENKEALLKFDWTQKIENGKKNGKMTYKREYLEFAPYTFPKTNIVNASEALNLQKKLYVKIVNNTETGFFNRYKEVKEVNVESLLNASYNPEVCLLPSQIPDEFKHIGENPNQYIGLIHLNVKYLKRIYLEMAYSDNERNADFNLFDYFKRIWSDVNTSCCDRHNFILQTELERPNVARIIDLQVNQNTLQLLQKTDLFEFKIQSNESIVRDFNFNTTLPSSFTTTIAVAAQAPASVDDLDSVTFANFNKGIKSRFTQVQEIEADPEKIEQYKEKQLEELQKLKIRYKKQAVQLAYYKNLIEQGRYIEEGLYQNIENFSTVISLSKALESTLNKLLRRHPTTGIPFRQIPKRRAAVVPLKFNAKIDGIGGIIIGNVFRIEKEKLPKGYQDDDIVFVVMGESQKITSGQDWTTEFHGQLMLLDSEDKYEVIEDEFKIPNTVTAAPIDNTRVVLDKINTVSGTTQVNDEIFEEVMTPNDDISEFFPDATIEEGDASLGNENREVNPNEQAKIEALRGNGTKYVGIGTSNKRYVAGRLAEINARSKLRQAAGVSNNASLKIGNFSQVDEVTTYNQSTDKYTVTSTYELR